MPLYQEVIEYINKFNNPHEKAKNRLIFEYGDGFHISRENTEEFAHAIMARPDLTELHFLYLRFENGALASFIKAIQNSKTITSIYFSNYMINDAIGFEALCALVKESKTLKSIGFYTQMTKAQTEAFALALQHNQTLVEISFLFNPFNLTGLQALLSAIKQNPQLILVDCMHIDYPKDAPILEEINLALKHNRDAMEENEIKKLKDILQCPDHTTALTLLDQTANKIAELDNKTVLDSNIQRIKNYYIAIRARVILRHLFNNPQFAYDSTTEPCVFSANMKELQRSVLDPTIWFNSINSAAQSALQNQHSLGLMATKDNLLTQKLYTALRQVQSFQQLLTDPLFNEILAEVAAKSDKTATFRK